MITGGDLRQSRLDVGYKTFTISPWVVISTVNYKKLLILDSRIQIISATVMDWRRGEASC